MDLAWLSLAALLVVILVSCTTPVNPGVLAVVLAWLIGVYAATLFGASVGLRQVVAGFPSGLFLTLVGVTLLFSQAQVNGTLERVARVAVACCRGNAGLIPVMFFCLTAGLASIGAGNIAASALMSPPAMAAATRARIPAFLMVIMVAHGAIAGALSPFSPTGVIVANLLRDKLGLEGHQWQLYFHNFAANAGVAFAGYFLFGGLRLFRQTDREGVDPAVAPASAPDAPPATQEGHASAPGPRFEWRHRLTLAVIGCLIAAVLLGPPVFGVEVEVGMAAFAGAVLLTLLRAADEGKAVRAMPWGVIVMVCGVTVLTALLEKTGGSDRLAEIIARVSTPETAPGVSAFVAGVVSVYSSTSGVVLPAFLPLVPGLVREMGGGDALAIASAVSVGGHLVDSSPLSTVGALCIACADPAEDRRVLFNKVLAWGLSMAVVGAVGCYLFF